MHYKDIIDLDELRVYASAMNRRACELRCKGVVTVDTLRGIILESGGRCAWCNRNLVKQDFEIDHIVALVNGGYNGEDNLTLTCTACNRKKGEKHPAKFALEIVAETGHQTQLTKRILDQYNLKPHQQQSLFDTDDDQPTTNNWTYTPPES